MKAFFLFMSSIEILKKKRKLNNKKNYNGLIGCITVLCSFLHLFSYVTKGQIFGQYTMHLPGLLRQYEIGHVNYFRTHSYIFSIHAQL